MNAVDLPTGPVRRPHLARLRQLPHIHEDPFDRLLVTQAVGEGLTLVTADGTPRRYPVARLW